MKRTAKTITIQTVARAAGVSVSTVSRVLNGKSDVAAETIEKVESVIQELGYVSSLAARSLRSHRTNVIGMVIPQIDAPYCTEIMRGVNRAIASINFDLIIYTNCNATRINAAEQERSFVTLLNGGITDGVVVVTPVATDFHSHAPVVIIDPNQENPQLPAVIATNYESAREVMEYLVGLGHRRIGFIAGRMELVSSIQRLQAYKDGLTMAGIPIDESLIQIGNYTQESGALCAKSLFSLENRPTAIFASNDESAMGVYQAACEAGLRIPVDLSVVGFDNIRDSVLLVPALTTVDQSVADMGQIATDMLVKLINGEKLSSILYTMKTKLVLRDSCSPPA